MDLTVSIDPSNIKPRWSDGSVEEITLTFTRTDGLLPMGNVKVGLGGYAVEPDADSFVTPTTVTQTTPSVVTATLLIGTTLQPTGQVWAWGQAHSGDQNPVNRCARNARLDFTGNTWSGGGDDFTLTVSEDGLTFTASGSGVVDNGDTTWTITDPGATDLGDTFQLVA